MGGHRGECEVTDLEAEADASSCYDKPAGEGTFGECRFQGKVECS